MGRRPQRAIRAVASTRAVELHGGLEEMQTAVSSSLLADTGIRCCSVDNAPPSGAAAAAGLLLGDGGGDGRGGILRGSSSSSALPPSSTSSPMCCRSAGSAASAAAPPSGSTSAAGGSLRTPDRDGQRSAAPGRDPSRLLNVLLRPPRPTPGVGVHCMSRWQRPQCACGAWEMLAATAMWLRWEAVESHRRCWHPRAARAGAAVPVVTPRALLAAPATAGGRLLRCGRTDARQTRESPWRAHRLLCNRPWRGLGLRRRRACQPSPLREDNLTASQAGSCCWDARRHLLCPRRAVGHRPTSAGDDHDRRHRLGRRRRRGVRRSLPGGPQQRLGSTRRRPRRALTLHSRFPPGRNGRLGQPLHLRPQLRDLQIPRGRMAQHAAIGMAAEARCATQVENAPTTAPPRAPPPSSTRPRPGRSKGAAPAQAVRIAAAGLLEMLCNNIERECVCG